MEAKIFEILSAMQVDLHEIKTDVAMLKTDMAEVKSDIVDLNDDVDSLKDIARRTELNIVRMENKMDQKFDALFDGYHTNTESIHRLEKSIKNHAVKLKIVK